MNELASKISDSELEVMRVLWEADEPVPIAQIRTAIQQSVDWDSSTIKTLLRRLCQKGVVIAEKKEVFYYHPVVTRRDYTAYSAHTMIDKLFQGSAKKLIASLVQDNQLSKEDFEELSDFFKAGGKQ